MKVVNLSPNFTPFGGVNFQRNLFPSKLEENFILPEEIYEKELAPAFNQKRDDILITFRPTKGENFLALGFAVDALRRLALSRFYTLHLHLYIPYLPYARQDRINNEGEAFTLKVFCDYVNSLGFDTVYTFDNHSDVSTALLNNCINVPNFKFVREVVDLQKDKYMLVCPDAGAAKKIYKLAKSLGYTKEIIFVDKVRNTATGKIEKIEVQPIKSDTKGKTLIIVDDICSYGGTFIGTAEQLRKEYEFETLILVVSHFEGVADPLILSKWFKYVFTSNSIDFAPQDAVISQIKIDLHWLTS